MDTWDAGVNVVPELVHLSPAPARVSVPVPAAGVGAADLPQAPMANATAAAAATVVRRVIRIAPPSVRSSAGTGRPSNQVSPRSIGSSRMVIWHSAARAFAEPLLIPAQDDERFTGGPPVNRCRTERVPKVGTWLATAPRPRVCPLWTGRNRHPVLDFREVIMADQFATRPPQPTRAHRLPATALTRRRLVGLAAMQAATIAGLS